MVTINDIDLIDRIKMLGTLGGTCLTWLIGEWEMGLQILVTCMILDYILGVLWGFKDKNLNSKIAYDGIKKKATILLILMLAVQLDRMLQQGWIFRTVVIYFYVSMESLSILETAGKFGVPIPEKLKKALVQLQEQQNEGDDKDD